MSLNFFRENSLAAPLGHLGGTGTKVPALPPSWAGSAACLYGTVCLQYSNRMTNWPINTAHPPPKEPNPGAHAGLHLEPQHGAAFWSG